MCIWFELKRHKFKRPIYVFKIWMIQFFPYQCPCPHFTE